MHGVTGIRSAIRSQTDRHKEARNAYALKRILTVVEARIAEAELIGWRAMEQSFREDHRYVTEAMREVQR